MIYPVKNQLIGEPPLCEAPLGPPEGGSKVAVDQGQLPLEVVNQFINIRGTAQQLQSVVGGDPAAAHLR